jgi:membrane-bound lytic murein transglycosylase D
VADSRSRIAFVILVALTLGGCQTMPPRKTADAPRTATVSNALPPDAAPPAKAPPAAKPHGIRMTHPPAPPALPVAQPTVASVGESVWDRLRDEFLLPGCDYAPETERWARRYAASPERFAATLKRMLPAIDYTQRRMEAAQLPGEFALLPIVESHFEPHPGKSGQPAGIWQMIAPTARSAGTRMDPWFDGRLNLIESTDAAVTLLDRYAEYFGEDWRLVAFAYNSGEFRVRKALDSHQPGEDFASLRGLGIASSTYEYLTKLLALSCLIRDPDRFDLTLPELDDDRELEEIELDGVMSVSLARALSGLSDDDFARVNGGMLKGRTPPGGQYRLLVAADTADRSSEVMAAIPASLRMDWQQRRLLGTESLDEIAQRNGMLLETLLALNDRTSPADVSSGTMLWLPGKSQTGRAQQETGASDDVFHVVRRGESLWSIARRHGVTVADLLRMNPRQSDRLVPGQRLRLTLP